jgi:ribose transport system substrate-binding protein
MKLFYGVAFSSLVFFSGPLSAQEKTFALVPKLQHPFFEQTHQGCEAAAKKAGTYRCLYIGPGKSSEEEQIQIIQDLISRKVTAMAIAPTNAPAVARALQRAKTAGIPVITFDSDLMARDSALRVSYVGTKNFDIGVALAKELLALKPEGGVYALQSGGAAAQNLQERIAGFRETLQGSSWQEAPGTPVYCNDDSALAVQQMEDLFTRFPNLSAFVAVGGWPQFAQSAYRRAIQRQGERVLSKKLLLLIADTLPVQMELLKEGLSHVQVGQRPFEMGYQAMEVLEKIVSGQSVPDPIYTGLDICRADNQTTCLGGH